MELITQTPIALALAGVLGLCMGSFLNVVIHRIPLMMNAEWRKGALEILHAQSDINKQALAPLDTIIAQDLPISLSLPRSRCPHCGHGISAVQNIPVISYILLGGKCKGCHAPISARYPLIEIASALLSVLAIWQFGANLAGVFAVFFVWVLIALTAIDFDTQLLPDRLVFPLGMLGLGAGALGLFTTPTQSIWGAVLGFLAFWSVASFYALLTKKQGMGHGDFKLLAAIGAWVGASILPLVILLSSLLGAFIGIILMRIHGESKPFAFGPYIAIAGFLALFFGQDIMAWYLGLFGAH